MGGRGERLFMYLYLFAFVQFITWMKDVTKKNLEWVFYFYVHIKSTNLSMEYIVVCSVVPTFYSLL